MSAARIATIGDLVADIVTGFPAFPIQEGDFIPASQLYLDAGGNANFLITAARLGGEPVALGCVGEDWWGKQVLDILEGEGISTRHLQAGGTTTVVQVLVDAQGGHAFLGHYGAGPALELDDQARRAIQGADALFCSGYSFADSRVGDFSLASLQAAREGAVPVYFDVGPASFEIGEEIIAEILRSTAVVLLTEEELPAVSGGKINEIFAAGPRIVVLKKGQAGCEIHLPDGKVLSAPGFPVEVVDTTAAGDSFAAGFITARCWGWELDKCAAFANAVGAAKVRKMGGGRNVPQLGEVREILEEFKVNLEF